MGTNMPTNEIIMIKALFPILSIINPKNGLVHAEIIMGIPNNWPAWMLSKLYFD